jgi:hypothetical protein
MPTTTTNYLSVTLAHLFYFSMAVGRAKDSVKDRLVTTTNVKPLLAITTS